MGALGISLSLFAIVIVLAAIANEIGRIRKIIEKWE